MPIYEYETIPNNASEHPVRFEVRQSMSDPELTRHPETGEPVRRVYAAFSVGAAATPQRYQPSGGGCCCQPGGACGWNN